MKLPARPSVLFLLARNAKKTIIEIKYVKVVTLKSMELVISWSPPLDFYFLELFRDVFKLHQKRRLVFTGIAVHTDMPFRYNHPDPFMRHEEGDANTDDHQGTSQPDYPDAGIFSYLQTGVLFGVCTFIAEDQGVAALGIDFGVIFEGDKCLRRAPFLSHFDTGGRAGIFRGELTDFLGRFQQFDGRTILQGDRNTFTNCGFLRSSAISRSGGDEMIAPLAGLPIAGLVKCDPLVGQRRIDDNLHL